MADPRAGSAPLASTTGAIDTEPGARVAAGLFAGAILLAAVDAGVIAGVIPLPAAGAPLRAWHHVFDAAETLGVGAVVAAGVGAFARVTRLPRWASALVAVAVCSALVHLALSEELIRVASLTLEGRFEHALFYGYILFLGALLPAATAVSAFLATRRGLGLLPFVFALAILIGNHVKLPDDYLGIHIVFAWGAAMVGGAALAPLLERAVLALRRRRAGRAVLTVVLAFAFAGVVVPPPNAVRHELFRHVGTIAPWILATTLWRAPAPRGPVPPVPSSPWFQDRTGAPPVPPAPPILPPAAVGGSVTIDAVRADDVADPANDALFPTLSDLKKTGVYFTHVMAPASQTALSLSTVFTGRYFSELSWVDYGVGRTRHLYPADDPSPRFPQILGEHGVATVNIASLIFLGNAWGVARGFADEDVVVQSWNHARAHELVEPLMKRLQHAGPGPLFAYTHLMEPHEPYDRGRKDGTPHERYLSEIAVADAQLGRLLRYLRTHFSHRWALIVSADHGEAFGDHDTISHGKTLYEELLHVPLLVASPNLRPRRVDTPVGLVDLGPTILDLFGLDTPPTFQGQSFAPLLVGRPVTFTRPLVAEGRLRRSITLPDGLKVIDDPRRKVVEAYDLTADPHETRNLWDVDPARVDPALATLRAFFAVHGRAEVPFKP